MQRNNLEMGNIAPQDISKQIPAWSIVTSAYLFRDADHLKKVFASDVGRDLKKMAEDQLNIRILGPTYFGARQVGLKPKKKINTPADMAGIKLRMPGGDAWQFLGQSLGANPTPMAYAEVYTGLQSGAIDGQDNPLPNVQNMKFYEVMLADRADLASRRLRPALRHQARLECDDRRRSRPRSRPRPTPRSTGARRSTSRRRPSWSTSSRSRGSRSIRPTSRRSATSRRRSTSPRIWPRAGRRACSTRSTRSRGDVIWRDGLLDSGVS